MNEGRFPRHRQGFARYLRDQHGIRFVPQELPPDVQTKYAACCYHFGAFYFRRVR